MSSDKKIICECGQEISFYNRKSHYNSNRHKNSLLNCYTKIDKKTIRKEYYLNNKHKILEYQKQYYKNNIDICKRRANDRYKLLKSYMPA
jgi:hypothetical protein